MSDIKLIYVVLKTFLFFIFLLSGYFLSRAQSNRQYWKRTIIPIVAFAMISGLRFGRQIDYNVYYFIYTQPNSSGDFEWLFSQILRLFRLFDISYPGFILFCSTFLIFSFLFFLRDFKKYILFVLPLLLGLLGIENLIRWYLGFSFLLLGVSMMLNKKHVLAIFFGVASTAIHGGIILVLIFPVLFYYFGNKFSINPKITIVLFAFSLFLGSNSVLERLVPVFGIFEYFGTTERMSKTVDNISKFASGEANTGVMDRSLVNNIRIFISFLFPIYFGYLFFTKFKSSLSNSIWLYNLAVFGIIIMPVFSLVEVFSRLSNSLLFFGYSMAGIVMYIAYNRRAIETTTIICLIISYLFLVYPILKIPFDSVDDNQMLFLWDAKGRNFLNY